MSVANDVLKWSKKNVHYAGSGNEIFVPNEAYPQMHITNHFVGYSARSQARLGQ